MFDVCLLGGGLSSVSVLAHLYQNGFRGSSALIERSSSFPESRTWGFWDAEVPNPFQDEVRSIHPCWAAELCRKKVVMEGKTHPYKVLRGEDVFRKAGELCRKLGVQCRFDTEVRSLMKRQHCVEISLSNGEQMTARYAVGSAAPTMGRDEKKRTPLYQSFYGEFSEDLGDDLPLLLRSVSSSPSHFDFIYELPLAHGRRLREYTRIAAGPARSGELAALFLQTFQRSLGSKVYGHESGIIPMGLSGRPRWDKRIALFGQAHGSTRASSGYTFYRVQRQAKLLANAIVKERPLPTDTSYSPLLNLLDAIFLEAVSGSLEDLERYFAALFQHLSGDRLARFMMSCPRLADLLAVTSSLPSLPFLKAAVRLAVVAGRQSPPVRELRRECLLRASQDGP